MRIGNQCGRLTLFTDAGAADPGFTPPRQRMAEKSTGRSSSLPSSAAERRTSPPSTHGRMLPDSPQDRTFRNGSRN